MGPWAESGELVVWGVRMVVVARPGGGVPRPMWGEVVCVAGWEWWWYRLYMARILSLTEGHEMTIRRIVDMRRCRM